MTDMQLLKKLLKRQKKSAVKIDDWKKLLFTEQKDRDGFSIEIASISVGFSFDKHERFEGIYNWKE